MHAGFKILSMLEHKNGIVHYMFMYVTVCKKLEINIGESVMKEIQSASFTYLINNQP